MDSIYNVIHLTWVDFYMELPFSLALIMAFISNIDSFHFVFHCLFLKETIVHERAYENLSHKRCKSHANLRRFTV